MKAFKHALLSLALFVGACATDVTEFTNLTPAAQVYVLKSQFDIHLNALIAYGRQPVCSPTVVVGCYDEKVLVELTNFAFEVDRALDAAEAAVAAHAPDAAEKIATARAMMNTLANRMLAEEISS